MKVIYVAGPYHGQNYSEIENNIKRAEYAGIQLIKNGWATIIPHKNSAHFEMYSPLMDIDNNFWVEMHLNILVKCDAVFMLKEWKKSSSSQREHQRAHEIGIKIYYEDNGYPIPLMEEL